MVILNNWAQVFSPYCLLKKFHLHWFSLNSQCDLYRRYITPRPLNDTVVGVQANYYVSYPIHVIKHSFESVDVNCHFDFICGYKMEIAQESPCFLFVCFFFVKFTLLMLLLMIFSM